HHWETANAGFSISSCVSLIVAPNGHVFAGTNSGMYRSDDQGDTWLPKSNGINQGAVGSMAVTASGLLFAGIGLGDVFRSLDDGESWHLLGHFGNSISDVEID